ncbi:PAS domain S-box protein [Haloarchaeobius sp. FL176]|uniref:PAS domain S-box protein n=1 Tax=Haloarchaeobius sp. FL176 TaxID=2967129 RepID=UPI0021483A52|nr:PAS domain S-box protein [Haloarchaeobius sp. FL176]
MSGGNGTLSVLVVGGETEVVRALSTYDEARERTVDSTHVSDLQGGQLHRHGLVLVDQGAADGIVDATGTVAATDEGPLVAAVVDDNERASDVLAAGASVVVPRSRLLDRPVPVLDSLVPSAGAESSGHGEPRGDGLSPLSDGAFEAVPDAVAVVDPESGEFRHVSERYATLVGYDRETLLELSVEGIATEDWETATPLSVADEVGDSNEPARFEWPVQTADGGRRWLESALQETTVEGERLLVSTARDVTARRAERPSVEQFLTDSETAMTFHDPETGAVLDANQRVAELVGYPDSEAVIEAGLGALSPVGGDRTLGELRTEIQRVGERIRMAVVDWATTDAGGDQVRLKAFATPGVRDGDRFVICQWRDVTERWELERTYRHVFESVSDGLVVHDPDTGEIVEVNGQFCEMTGYEREELLGESVDMITAKNQGYSFERVRSLIGRAAEEGPQLFEWWNESADGETFPVEVHLSLAEIHGTERVLASVRDITQRKRREREFEQIFNNVNDAIAVHDPETAEFIDVNDTYVEQFGYDVETIRELGIEGLSKTDGSFTAERGREVIRRVHETGEPETVELWVERADGEERVYEVNATAATIDGEERVLTINRDITERRRREREYEQVFDGVNDAISVHDPWREEMLDANRTLCELVGYDRETVLDRGIDGISVDDQGFTEARAYELQREVAESGEPQTAEWRVETADGERRVLETNVTPATIGGEQRILVLSRDVTERRRRSRQLELIVGRIDEAVALSEEATTVGEPEYLSPVVEDIFGLPHEELAEDTTVIRSRIHEDDLEQYEAEGAAMLADAEAGETKDRYDFEFRYHHPNGDLRWIHLTAYPMPDVDGYGRVAVFEDITEQKRREQEYEQIFDAVIDGITVHDTETGEIVDANEAMSDLVGYDAEEMVGMDIGDLSPTESGYTTERGLEIIDRVMERGEPEVVDWVAETADGEHRWLEVKATPVVIGGEERYLAIDRDISERREREEELKRTQRQFRQISEAVDEVIHLAAADLSETYYLSPAYEDIWGRPLEDMYEDPFAFEDTIHPDDSEEFLTFLDDVTAELTDPAVDERDQYSYEYRVERDDGDVRWIDGRLYPIRDDEGRVTRLVSVSRDVTESRRRRETLESFQEATAELSAADSTSAACRTAVQAATSVFDLRAVAVYTHDEISGALVPTATSEGLGSPDELPEWNAADTVQWEAFVDERVVELDAGENRPVAVGPDVPLVVMPLSGHGVLVVWADDEAPVETAHLIAATLEGALNHVVGERRLESQRAELEAQTARAEQLERIARLNRRVEAAITDESSRVGVERALCEHLVEIEPFVHAWVAERQPSGESLELRTTTGLSRETVGRWLQERGDDQPEHPAITASRTDEVCVDSDLVGGAGWRRDLLRRGVQSICAVPLSYEGIVHGVLVIHAATPNAFEEPARETLDQLGNSIGYAVTAIERRRALESDETLEIELRETGASVPFAHLASTTGCQVRHDRTVRRQDGSLRIVYTVVGDVPDELGSVADDILPGETTVLSEGDDRVVLERTGTTWFGSIVSEFGGVLRRAHATPDRTSIVVELPTDTETRRFVHRLQERIPELELHAQRQQAADSSIPGELTERLDQRLSPRQKEALQTAFRLGYFDWPREHSGEDIAETMDITQPTLNKHLRVAERKLVASVLEEMDR